MAYSDRRSLEEVPGLLVACEQRRQSGYRRPMPRVLWWSQEGRKFLVSEVPRYSDSLSLE